MSGILIIVLIAVFIGVPWLVHTIINNAFDKGAAAIKNRKNDSEVERIREQIEHVRRDNDQ